MTPTVTPTHNILPQAQQLTLAIINAGPDDDGALVVNYGLYRGDGTLLATLQSTVRDVAIFAQADQWAISYRPQPVSTVSDPLPLNRTCKSCNADYHDPGGPVGAPERACPVCGSKAWFAGPAIALAPRDLNNHIAREGCDFCVCGCKYWENDRCVDCDTLVTDVPTEVRNPS